MIKDFRVALREWPAPEAASDLRERILRSRAGGSRVPLPLDRGTPWRLRLLVAAAAVVAIVAIADRVQQRRERPQEDGRDLYADLFGGVPWSPSVGVAQEASAAPTVPRYALIVAFEPSRVAGGTWTYERWTTTDDIITGRTGSITISASAVQLDGTPAWLVTTASGAVAAAADSLFVSRETLRPLRHTIHGPKSRVHVVQQYSPDSVHETIDWTAPNERHLRSSVQLPGIREAPLLTYPTDLNLLAQALPLDRDWSGSAYVVQLITPGPTVGPRFFSPQFFSVDLRVIGRDRVTVPAGTFDCWKVEVIQRHGNVAFRTLVWASRDRHFIVKAEEKGGDFVTRHLLATYTTPPAP